MQEIRQFFPITKSKVFMDHARLSPCSELVRREINRYLQERIDRNGDWHHLYDRAIEAKKLFASLIKADINEIAFMSNTSQGINTIVNGLHIPDGSNVVTDNLEYPSVVYPWLSLQKRKNIRVRSVKAIDGVVHLEDVEQMVDDNTIAIAISHVEYQNGFRNDLKALSDIAHEHDAYLLVDAIQSVGALEVDVKNLGVDFLATGGYKWLLGPVGTAFLYVDKQYIESIDPIDTGWASPSRRNASSLNNKRLILSDNADRFEIGTFNAMGFVGLAASIKLLLDFGSSNVARRIMHLIDYLINHLMEKGVEIQSPLDSQYRSGILNVKVNHLESADEKLQSKDVYISAFPPLKGVRISPHFYNTEEEADLLINELTKL